MASNLGDKTAKNGAKPKNGRPSIRSNELAQEIFERISQGESLNRICKSGLISWPTVCRWLLEDEVFRKNYELSRELQAEKFADEIVDISDDGENDTYVDKDGNHRTDYDVIARSRLRVDARKWVISKLLPKKYGDRPNETHVTTSINNFILSEDKQRELQQRADLALRGGQR